MIELISSLLPHKELNGDLVLHYITCSEGLGQCVFNLNGMCKHERPLIIKPYQNGMRFPGTFMCNSFEKLKEKAKEDLKIRITYKSIDKQKKVLDYLNSIQFVAGVNKSIMADQISSIYNAKEEDGEIEKVIIDKDNYGFFFAEIPYSSDPILFSLWEHDKNHSIRLSKEEFQILAKTLSKMSDQLKEE